MKDELKRQCTIVILKITLFFASYLLSVIVGGLIVYATFYGFVNYSLEAIVDLFNEGMIFYGVLLILFNLLICGFFILYGLYPMKFLFRRNKKGLKNQVEISEADNPQLFALIRDVATATGNRMPLHVYVSPEVNACVFYENTLQSIFLPTRKNLMVGIGLCANTNTEELKAVMAHEFGHFSQKTMKVGSAIYYANVVMYDMAFQEDRWDMLLDKLFRSFSNCRYAGWYGLAVYAVLFVLYHILVFAKDLLRWMYKFVNSSYYSLSRQMEYDADKVACDVVGRDVFVSSMVKIEFAANCNENSIILWRRLLYSGHYASLLGTAKFYERVVAEERNTSVSYDVLKKDLYDVEEYHSEISFSNVFSDHPSTRERIEAVKNMPDKRVQNFIPAASLFDKDVERLIEIMVYPTGSGNIAYEEAAHQPALSGEELKEWIKSDCERAFLPLKYRIFFNSMRILPIDYIDIASAASYPFNDENRNILYEYISASKDYTLLLQLAEQDEIEYVSYKGHRYAVSNLPIGEHRSLLDMLYGKCLAVQRQMYAYLSVNSPKEFNVRNMYLYLFDAFGRLGEINQIDEEVAKIAERLQNPIDDDDEPDDFFDVKVNFKTLDKSFRQCISKCNVNIFPFCIGINAVDEKIINDFVAISEKPVPEYQEWDIGQVVDVVCNFTKYKNALNEVLSYVVMSVKRDLVSVAEAIENNKAVGL